MDGKKALEFQLATPDITSLEVEYVTQAVKSGWVSSLGEFIGRFERGFAELCEAGHAVAVSNGTVALHLTLVALGIGPGDEVIVPSLTFVATAAAVVHAGATPVFVDSEFETFNMDPEAVAAAFSERTKAVIAVHLYGHPAEMARITNMAHERDCVVIEDAAEAHGALYRTQKVGSIGRAGTFSFYGNKLLTTGEGGAVVTNDGALADKLRFLKDHAMDPLRRYWHPEIGFNYRMTNLQAALGCAQIERFEQMVRQRQALIDAYRDALSDLPVKVNPAMDWARPAPWLATVLLPPNSNAAGLAKELRNVGVDTRPFFAPIQTMPPYKEFRSLSGSSSPGCPVASELYRRGILLPTVPTIRVELLLSRVHKTMKNYLNR